MEKLMNYLYLQKIGHYWRRGVMNIEPCTSQQEKDITLLALELKKGLKIHFLT